MDGQFAGEVEPAPSCLDGIDVADQISNGDIGSCKFLDVSLRRREIRNRSRFALLRDQIDAAPADRIIWIVVNFAIHHIRQVCIEKASERSQHAALGLSAQAEQDEVMP